MVTIEKFKEEGFVYAVSEFRKEDEDTFLLEKIKVGTHIQFTKSSRRISLVVGLTLGSDSFVPVGVHTTRIHNLFSPKTSFTLESSAWVKVITLTREEEIKLIPFTA